MARFITESFSSPTKQQERAAELRAQGFAPITRTLGAAQRSSQPQRTPTSEGRYVVEYLPKIPSGYDQAAREYTRRDD